MPDTYYTKIMWAMACVFVIKSLFLAFYVTPLWDIPDEIGHYSYVSDIANGKGIPLLGQAKLDEEALRSFYRNCESTNKGCESIGKSNWIAQHPPIYHIIASVPLKISMMFTKNKNFLFRSTRITSAICLGFFFICTYYTMVAINLKKINSLFLASSICFIPMISNLSSGNNHDIMLLLFASTTAYFLIIYIHNGKPKFIYLSAFFTTLSSGIKITFWVIIPILLLIYSIEILKKKKTNKKILIYTMAIAISIPMLVICRNIYNFNTPIFTSINLSELTTKSNISLLDYIHTYPIFDILIQHFYGLFGWMGNGWGEVKLLVTSGSPLIFFSFLLLFTSLLLTISSLSLSNKFYNENFTIQKKTQFLNKNYTRKLTIAIGIIIAFTLSYIICFTNYSTGTLPERVRLCAVFFTLFSGLNSIFISFYTKGYIDRISIYNKIIFLFFSLILINKLHDIYQMRGELGAMHGRYFYAILPFLLIDIGFIIKKFNIPSSVLLIITFILSYMELISFTTQVIPFYEIR